MNRVRVLVVDDQPTVRRALALVVAATDGFDVVAEAGTGEAAVEASHRWHPDMVVMDVNLPGIDGVEATRRLLVGSDPPAVLLVSTHDDDLGAALVTECGAAGYLTKSDFAPETLAAAWSAARSRPDGA